MTLIGKACGGRPVRRSRSSRGWRHHGFPQKENVAAFDPVVDSGDAAFNISKSAITAYLRHEERLAIRNSQGNRKYSNQPAITSL
jgi:hypothetical protein